MEGFLFLNGPQPPLQFHPPEREKKMQVCLRTDTTFFSINIPSLSFALLKKKKKKKQQ